MQALLARSRISVQPSARIGSLVSIAQVHGSDLNIVAKLNRFPPRVRSSSVFGPGVLPGGTRGASTAAATGLHVSRASAVPPVTKTQLRQLAVCSAVPMIGFGMMDQFIMVTAGDMIDLTLGVTFGLATLTSAAFGQVISDFCGVTFGGTLEAFSTKLGLPVPDLSAAQRQLPRVKFVATAAAAVGVVLGCLIGALSLLFKDTGAAERMKRRKELNTLFSVVVMSGNDIIKAERCSLFLVDSSKNELWTTVHTGLETFIRLPMDGNSVVAHVARTGEMVNVTDAHADPRFNSAIDNKTGFRTKTILCAPVLSPEGKVVAVVQLINHAERETEDSVCKWLTFGPREEDLLRMLCKHCAVFMQQIEG